MIAMIKFNPSLFGSKVNGTGLPSSPPWHLFMPPKSQEDHDYGGIETKVTIPDLIPTH